MTSAKHTPGPWRLDTEYPSIDVFGADGSHICDVDAGPLHNARLIAAAPDLLEACERLLIFVETDDENPPECTCEPGDVCMLCAARAAIARARGGK